MVSQVQTPPIYSPEDYLELEIASETRNEYINGEIIPMAGGMPNHNQIALNIAGTLNFLLKRQPYRVYTYPDVMVVSGDLFLQEGRKDTIINPILIIEVLSKSTGSFDRDQKFNFYRSLPSFQEYLLVDQYRYSVQHYVKISTKKWEFQEYDSLEEEIKFSTVPCAIALTEIYDKVELETPEYGT